MVMRGMMGIMASRVEWHSQRTRINHNGIDCTNIGEEIRDGDVYMGLGKELEVMCILVNDKCLGTFELLGPWNMNT
jgi:hypothetical protein